MSNFTPPPPGNAFGEGIYLADLMNKSLGYCGYDKKATYILACDAAIGNVKTVGGLLGF